MPDQTTLSILNAHIFLLVKAEWAHPIDSQISDQMKTELAEKAGSVRRFSMTALPYL
jgi:uncharacterized lipoprotein YmbA